MSANNCPDAFVAKLLLAATAVTKQQDENRLPGLLEQLGNATVCLICLDRKSGCQRRVQTPENLLAVVYVAVVLSLYACIIMAMIFTSTRRQRLEGQDAEYYEEFLRKREHFKYAMMVTEARRRMASKHVRIFVEPTDPRTAIRSGRLNR